MPFLPTPAIRIQPYFGYRNRDRLLISARALRSRAGSFERRGRLRAIRTMLAQFASHEVADFPVELEIAGPPGASRRHQGVTDAEGFVHFDIRLDPQCDYADHPKWETVVLHWFDGAEEQSAEGHVLAPGRETSLAVISDIDDTIVETGITGGLRAVLRNWRRVLVEMPDDRILVPGAEVFYNALGGGAALEGGAGQAGNAQPATQRPFFYVSSSPWNLFGYLVAYIRSRGLPLGPIALRDWGLDRATFGSSSHGAHKREAISRILALYPELKFALIGDDSQGDLMAFAAVAKNNPGRVRAIFIRRLGEAMTPEEATAQASIAAAHIPLWLGDSYHTGHDFLASIGLLGDEQTRAIVEAVDAAASD